ncbi:MAG TPA: RDD family protein [Gammaproteobacteria bacterium]
MPEATDPAPPVVGLARRFAAILYDGMALFAVLFFATWLLVALTGGTLAPGHALLRGSLFTLGCAFFTYFWSHGGQTIGMQAWRIRLVADDGGPVRWTRALTRCMVALLSWACLGAGFWWALFDRERRTWHDRASGTRLVRG